MTIRLLSLLTLILPAMLSAAPSVTVSIKPVHSLVVSVMQGVAEPGLLFENVMDPHHAHMTPAMRRQLADADLIVWVGPRLETSLSRAISQSAGRPLTLLKTDLPQLHEARSHHGDDPHIWLSPANAKRIVEQLADSLIALDPDNRTSYARNRDNTLAAIDELAQAITQQLNGTGKRYIAHHDAYQYFEKSFDLEGAGFIKNSHNEEPGFRIIRELGELVRTQQVNCIVYDAQQRPDIIGSLGETDLTRYSRLPGVGAGLTPGKDLWFDMMTMIGDGFAGCLR